MFFRLIGLILGRAEIARGSPAKGCVNTPGCGRLPPRAVLNGNQNIARIDGKRLCNDAR